MSRHAPQIPYSPTGRSRIEKLAAGVRARRRRDRWIVEAGKQTAEGVGDYVALSGDALAPSGYQPGVEGFANPEACHEFHWSVADKLDAVASAGLVIETVREFPYANGWRGFPTMLEIAPRKFRLADDAPTIPMMLGFSATSPETRRRA